MGANCCKPEDELSDPNYGSTHIKTFVKPRWRSDDPVTATEIEKMRAEFWDTEPHYGGDRVIWDALKAASEANIETARLILESAGVNVVSEDMTICYDERGQKYMIPKYAISDPSNIAREGSQRGIFGSRRTNDQTDSMELQNMER